MAFIHYFQEFFKGFSVEDELSVFEFQLLMDLIGVNISKKILHESAMYIKPVSTSTYNSDSSASSMSSSSSVSSISSRSTTPTHGSVIKKYSLSSLKDSLFFSILFEDWLAYTEQLFKDHGTLNSIDTKILRAYLGIDRSGVVNAPPLDIIGLSSSLQ